jgi:hypothetical protein
MTRQTTLVSAIGRLAVSLAILCAASLGAGTAAHANPCFARFPFGTVSLARSNFAAGTYGADLKLLYGDWEWLTTFGLATDATKADSYVESVAELVRDCVGDLEHGRLDFTRHQVIDSQSQLLRAETDPEYFVRAFDDLVKVRQELARIELELDARVHMHAPAVSADGLIVLKNTENETQLRFLQLAADRSTGIGWVVVLAQDLEDELESFQTAHELTRQLITDYVSDFPGVRDLVINRLINNTGSVVDQYGEFFSPAKQAQLQALLTAAAAERQDENLTQAATNLGHIADSIQDQLPAVWDQGEPLKLLAVKLKFIFGGCTSSDTNHPLASSTYFGDLPVATRFVTEGGHAAFCVP